uniref:Bystin n=1 Tax=Ciona savignyi TaxID=51511 RepID=H2ZB40_CIOSA
MGKVRKNRTKAVTGQNPHYHRTDLSSDIVDDSTINENPKKTAKERKRQEDSDIVNDKLTKKILDSARKQQDELENPWSVTSNKTPAKLIKPLDADDGSDDDEADWPVMGSGQAESSEYKEDIIEVDADDEKALEAFMNPNPPTRRTLADIIMDKIAEKQSDVSTLMPDLEKPMPDMDPRIIEVYQDVRTILQRYRCGKLPKAFKVLPHLKNWEEVLYITEPDGWTAAAMYQATRIFASNMNAHMAQRFFFLVLLPRIRDDIQYFKRLNFHLFMALKKTLFKPAAFFKGILLPLCEEGTCTLREATIIGSAMTKCSIPVLHASAAMLKLAEMKYSGPNSIFLKILITKKYALPFRVIDALVFHFLSFRNEKRMLPVLWHQALLSFAEIYGRDISSEQKDSMLELLRHQSHEQITSLVRHQLQNVDCRDIEMDEPLPMPL